MHDSAKNTTLGFFCTQHIKVLPPAVYNRLKMWGISVIIVSFSIFSNNNACLALARRPCDDIFVTRMQIMGEKV